ncbi:MAG TPA: site-2 protease family protein [Thermoleophilaceae bacterium]
MSWAIIALGFMALIVLHELGHFTAAKAVGMRVERFALFFPPLIVKKKFGETEYGIGAIPLGGYVKISGMSPAEELPDEVRTRAYYSQPVWKRIVVIGAGPFVNLVIAFAVLLVFWGAIGAPTQTKQVGATLPGYPAQNILQKNDQIVSVDGQTGDAPKISRLISAHKCAVQPPTKGCVAQTPAHLVVKRDGKLVPLAINPKYDPASKRMLVGFSYAISHHPEGIGRALSDSVNDFWYVARQTASLPARILNSHERKQISGVVGVSDVAHTTIQTDPALAVRLLAIVSLSLAIVNLFPFLPLDGGHIFWAVVELFRRRPVSYSVMERAGIVGFMLVVMLFIIGLTNDIGRINSGGF